MDPRIRFFNVLHGVRIADLIFLCISIIVVCIYFIFLYRKYVVVSRIKMRLIFGVERGIAMSNGNKVSFFISYSKIIF